MLPVIGELRPWADPSITAINRCRMHTPLPRADLVVLDGDWHFERWDHPDMVPAEALTDGVLQQTVAVPGNWTLQGTVDLPHYTNVQMPFPGAPPTLPDRCPTAVYRRRVAIPWSDRRVFVRVNGADSVHAVYVDGRFVGYGTDSRLPSEYELTAYLEPDADEIDLAIVVLRYSAHSYLEDQDKWWMAGLHRSVVLEARPAVHLGDVVCAADVDPATGRGDLTVTCDLDVQAGAFMGPGWSTTLSVLDAADHVVASASAVHQTRHHVTIDAVHPWSAETPVRYRVVVELVDPSGQVVDHATTRCGFRCVEVIDRQLLVNGQPVWVFGVNRHEHHPDRGAAVTEADMRADLTAMRAHNITAVRTAHYPNHEAFYDLCDELGFYVIDEANIEGHAFMNSLCDDERYRPAFLERGARMVQRDRNHPCVIAWSLGNETGYGANHDALAGWIRRSDPTRPLHYEGAMTQDERCWVDGGRAVSDLVCPMYPSIEAIERYGLDPRADRPLIMCEFSHAMGNSNGSLADYWDVITRTPGLQGGFIWEWKDHGLRALDGSGRLCVGGDFGDDPHDANFVADGLVGADGQPHPALHEVAWVYRPVTVDVVGGEQATPDHLRISNRRSFTGLDDLEARWEVLVDGETSGVGSLDLPPVAPHTTVDVPLPVEARRLIGATDGETVLTLRWHQRDDTWFAPAGHVCAWDQSVVAIGRHPCRLPVDIAPTPPSDQVMLTEPEPIIWRAPVDNDGFKRMSRSWLAPGVGGRALERWRAAGFFDHPTRDLVSNTCAVETVEGGHVYRWRIDVPDTLSDPARVGVRWAIPRRFDRMRWYGRGPGENYPDRNRGSLIGRWHEPADAMPYLVPQDHALRTDVRWMACDDPDTGETLWIRALQPRTLHLAVTEYSAEQLYATGNAADLQADDRRWVHVDVVHRGVGTASCGPDVLPRYRIGPGRYEFAFWVGVTRDEGVRT